MHEFSDLPSPARTTNRAKGFAQAENPHRVFGIMYWKIMRGPRLESEADFFRITL
jgi:hypothetical protein